MNHFLVCERDISMKDPSFPSYESGREKNRDESKIEMTKQNFQTSEAAEDTYQDLRETARAYFKLFEEIAELSRMQDLDVPEKLKNDALIRMTHEKVDIKDWPKELFENTLYHNGDCTLYKMLRDCASANHPAFAVIHLFPETLKEGDKKMGMLMHPIHADEKDSANNLVLKTQVIDFILDKMIHLAKEKKKDKEFAGLLKEFQDTNLLLTGAYIAFAQEFQPCFDISVP